MIGRIYVEDLLARTYAVDVGNATRWLRPCGCNIETDMQGPREVWLRFRGGYHKRLPLAQGTTLILPAGASRPPADTTRGTTSKEHHT